jgi:hypothetical protein
MVPVPHPRSPLPPPLPRGIDRVPRGPERIVALSLAVLALAAVVVHHGWQSRIAGHAANLERNLVRSVRGEQRTPPPTASADNQPPIR